MRSLPSRRRPSQVLLALVGLFGGCRVPVSVESVPGRTPRCENGVCVEVVSFASHLPNVGMWIEAPAATRLVNAHLIADEGPLCGGHLPVEWVRIDKDVRRWGPADIAGGHGVVLGFPINAWWGHSGYWLAMFVDVELDVAGSPRCVRTRLTGADGKAAVGQ